MTFCIPAERYASRLGAALDASLSPALCVSKCDFGRFPSTGCRAGLHCELHHRYMSEVQDEVCVPGPWSVGLAIDGDVVRGVDAGAPEPAEPYARLLELSCGGVFEGIDAALFRGLATTLLAMDSGGRERNWERLCAAPGSLPDRHGIRQEADAGRGFRLGGSRTQIIDWSAQGIYGGKQARGSQDKGPLYPLRVMVYAGGGTHYLYADAGDDFPHYDPERRRHFGVINGQEWGPLDAELQPDVDFVTVKADGGHRFYRQWGRSELIRYTGAMARDYLLAHGEPLGIGDISLPTGGDIDGHASHEVGRDIDLYLLTYERSDEGQLRVDAPLLWVSDCRRDGGGWECWYFENRSGLLESDELGVHATRALMLTTLAQYTRDVPGVSRFVQNDVEVLAPFRASQPAGLRYIDASNAEASGWPPHRNHIHLRFDL